MSPDVHGSAVLHAHVVRTCAGIQSSQQDEIDLMQGLLDS